MPDLPKTESKVCIGRATCVLGVYREYFGGLGTQDSCEEALWLQIGFGNLPVLDDISTNFPCPELLNTGTVIL